MMVVGGGESIIDNKPGEIVVWQSTSGSTSGPGSVDWVVQLIYVGIVPCYCD
jgi:hypothetical protein